VDLAVELRAQILHYPYKLVAGVPILDTWGQVLADIIANGTAPRWCALNILAVEIPPIPGAVWYAGDIPEIPEDPIMPVEVDPDYKADLLSTGSATLTLLRDPEWFNFVARFQQMTPEQVEASPVFNAALEMEMYLSMLTDRLWR